MEKAKSLLSKVNQEKLGLIVDNVVKHNYIHGVVFNIESGDGSLNFIKSAGNISENSKYYIASINKLFISAIVLKLINEGKLNFSDKLSKFASKTLIKGIHIFNGKDYTQDITIEHLLSQTSGLPDYLSDKSLSGRPIIKELENGVDVPCSTETVISLIKTMKATSIPGEKTKYIDTGHQLLNLVIEDITKKPIKDVLNEMFKELDMKDTYVCENVNDVSYIYPYYKSHRRSIGKFVTSTQNDIISTAKDQMIFIKSFFCGHFYPKEKLKTLEKWNDIFFPFKYGIGIQKFYMPRFLSPFKSVPYMIGHCGSTGSVAFYIPELDIYITGTTNQQAMPSKAFQTIIKIIHLLK